MHGLIGARSHHEEYTVIAPKDTCFGGIAVDNHVVHNGKLLSIVDRNPQYYTLEGDVTLPSDMVEEIVCEQFEFGFDPCLSVPHKIVDIVEYPMVQNHMNPWMRD